MRNLTLGLILLATLLASITCSQAAPAPMPTAQTVAASTSVFGLNSHIASRYPDFGTLNRPASLVKDLGIGWAREDVQWSRVEPRPGAFDWSWHDTVFDLHRRNGINIIGVIGPSVGWATPAPNDPESGVSFYPPDPDRYAAFARAVAERYKGKVQAWEIWNEPENASFWQPAPDPAAYARMLIKAYAAIKSVDPSVTVLSAGVVPFDQSFLTALAANGAWGSFDALAVHPYVDPFTPETAQIDVVGIKNVQALAARYGSKPTWVTEYGWGSGACERDPVGRTNEDQQANNLVRGGVLLRAAGAERVLWYNFKDPQQPCYGIVRGGGGISDYSQLKPAAIALKVLSQQIGGSQPLGSQNFMPSQVVVPLNDARGWGAPFPTGKPPLTASTEQSRNNSPTGRIRYEFTSADNDYVAFPRSEDTPLPGDTTRIGLWVYGDGSGHMLQARIADQQGEVLQYRLGYIGAPGWQFLTASLTGEVEEGNRITGGNGRLDGALRFKELIVDDSPNSATGSGTIYIDDLTAFQGADTYVQRFQAGGEVVDVVWSPSGGTARIPTASASATVTQRDGSSSQTRAENGTIPLSIGPAPIYVRHVPGSATNPPAAPPAGGAPAPSNGSFATPNFQRVWERTDRPVAEGRLTTPRTWLWGPQPLTAAHREPYANSPEGSRQVQYFDKSRMEINNPANGQVTNGLLVVELITGRVQVGDDAFTDAAPAEQAVAGDPTEANPQGPTYASFRSVAYPVNPAKAPIRSGQRVIATIRRDGSTGEDASLARYGVTIGSYDETLGHNVPRVFTDFFAQRGLVYEGSYRQGQVIDAIFAVGLPISEPYWARVNVGGVEKDVLMQAFQRRVLTYTPSNPAGFQVEMGNVGQHYLRWRYGR